MIRNFIKVTIIFLTIVVVTSCDDDSIFDIKVKTANGITTVSGIRPGGLDRALLLSVVTIKNLAINDTIDSRDIKTIRDEMTNLETLDLSKATIAAYGGYDGTAETQRYYYAANQIPAYAFYNPKTSKGKSKLTTILLPENITSIGDYAFTACGLSGNLTIPSSVTDTIGISAFAYCQNLTHIDLPSVAYIGPSAFQSCTSLTGELVIPDSVISIKSWAFAYCAGITNISIPQSLSEIEKTAFCGSGTAFTVDAGNTSYTSVDGVLYNTDITTLVQFPGSKSGSFSVPESVLDIGPFSFAFCTGLTGISLPAGLNFIEDNAFYGCTALSGNFPIPASLLFIGTDVFEDCSQMNGFSVSSSNTNFTYSDGVLVDAAQFTVKRCIVSKSGSYTIESDIQFVDNSAFSNCTNLSTITIAASVLSIGKRAFFNCTGLLSIYLKSSTPIDMSDTSSAFELVTKDQITLYVPTGSLQTYLNTSVWNEFGNIVEN